ncbi:uncharacterized protein LOC116933612 [Daphnia magna]|uniref:uncharacterized protein LOC116933612 n=1 Tax=Daphnia magna TaxID=35525 RepID=UPI001E1BDDF5|nr:uncharacterized protein LOC116933612 [Daphnia magna]
MGHKKLCLSIEEQKARVKKYNDSRRKGMKSFGLFSRGSNNSGDGSKQKNSEIAVTKSMKRKRDESCSRCPEIHDQPADSFDVEPDFNQTVPQFLQSALESSAVLEQKLGLSSEMMKLANVQLDKMKKDKRANMDENEDDVSESNADPNV